MQIEIREATQADAPIVAWAVAEAMDLEDADLRVFEEVCADPMSLYSFRNALIATVDGAAAGCLVAYDGACYLPLREYTWPKLWPSTQPLEEIADVEAETKAGEYYLDTMALYPQYRGLKIGTLLIKEALRRTASVHSRAALIVAKSKPRLKSYYESLGFEACGEMLFFGHEYVRMHCNIN